MKKATWQYEAYRIAKEREAERERAEERERQAAEERREAKAKEEKEKREKKKKDKKYEFRWHENAIGFRPGSMDDYEPVRLSRREKLEEANKRLQAEKNKDPDKHVKSISELIETVKNDIYAQRERGEKACGIKTGIEFIDSDITGFRPAELILVCAESFEGKTVLMQRMAANMTIRDNRSVLVLNLEMTNEAFTRRLIAMEARIEKSKVIEEPEKMEEEEWEKFSETTIILSDTRLYLDYAPGCTVDQICHKCREYKEDKDLEIVLIDYLQCIRAESHKKTRKEDMRDICFRLKKLAQDLDIPIIVFASLPGEGGVTKTEIVDNADVIMTLKGTDNPEDDCFTIIIRRGSGMEE